MGNVREERAPEREHPACSKALARRRVTTALLAVLLLGLPAIGCGAWSVACAALAGLLLLRWCDTRLLHSERQQATVELRAEADAANARAQQLEFAHERARSVLDALQEGVFVVDAAGAVVLANPAARRAMDRPGSVPVGQLLWSVLPAELGERARSAWQALRRGGGERPAADPAAPPLVRCAAIPGRGTVYDLAAVEATSAHTGQDFGTVFLLVDSTRNHELQQLKDRFLSSISHELRTPLTNICAYAEILRTMLPGESVEWPEFVRVIHEQGLHLSRLVDGMFDYLQLESGEAPFRDDVFDAAAIVRTVAVELGEVARSSAIELVCAAADNTAPAPDVRGDAKRFAQVVRKLIDNAIKFTPRGGRILVTTARRADGFELRVDDTGCGVPPAARQSVFETFHQLADPLTDKPAGTGLGLATSRAIVTRLGGLLWCEGSPLGGAAFVLLLPGVGQPRLAVAASGCAV
ncbi:MAG: PAS domain-containing sensor histidine kinase [Planctomycetes bacterium]|nr:PAS domain-containing sensor histidine kinase [Planctomycetota bacterium]